MDSDDDEGEQQDRRFYPSATPAPAATLPDELLLLIFRRVQDHGHAIAQPWLYSASLVCRQWYRIVVPFLFYHPLLTGHKFQSFVNAICPSINLHVRTSPLSRWVRILDLGRLVHQGSKSVTARLLGRVKDNLLEFVAPQASFAINCFPALSKCVRLEKLDLSLVSDAPNLQMLFHSVQRLDRLVELRLPRSAGFGSKLDADRLVFATGLKRLFLSGGIDANFLRGVVQLPLSLRELTLEHCPGVRAGDIQSFLWGIHSREIQLVYLKISFLPRLIEGALDLPLVWLMSTLVYLSVGLDYVSTALFDHLASGVLKAGENGPLPLQVLQLTNSSQPGDPDKLTGLDIMSAIEEGCLSRLRQVRVANSLGWTHPDRSDETAALHDMLRDLPYLDDTDSSKRDMPSILTNRRPIESGVYIIQG